MSNCQHPLDHWKSKSFRKTSASLTTPKPLTVIYCYYSTINHGKFFKRWELIPDHLTCLLRNLYAGQEATVRTGHETTDWFQIGKGVCQGCILSPYLFNLYAEYIMQMPSWMKHKLESWFPGEVSVTLDNAGDTTLWQKEKRNYRASW